MALNISVSLSESSRRVQRQLERGIPEAVEVASGKSMLSAAEVAAAAVRRSTKFSDVTGNLRSAVSTRRVERGGRVYAQLYFTRPKGAHSALVEYGHNVIRGGRVVGRAVGRYFVQDALEETEEEQIQAAGQAFDGYYDEAIQLLD